MIPHCLHLSALLLLLALPRLFAAVQQMLTTLGIVADGEESPFSPQRVASTFSSVDVEYMVSHPHPMEPSTANKKIKRFPPNPPSFFASLFKVVVLPRPLLPMLEIPATPKRAAETPRIRKTRESPKSCDPPACEYVHFRERCA